MKMSQNIMNIVVANSFKTEASSMTTNEYPNFGEGRNEEAVKKRA